MNDRLHRTIDSAGIPIDGVSVGRNPPATVRVDYRADATQAQRNQGAQIVATFDWSDAAQAAWERTRARADADAAIGTDPSPAAQFQRAVLAELVASFNGLVDYLDAQAGLGNKPTLRALKRTRAQWVAAVKARLAAGDGDPT